MQWPIDTSEFSFMGSLPSEPVLDQRTRQQKTGLNGEPRYCMELMCFWEEGPEILTVSLPGTPPAGLREGMPVRVTGLLVSECSTEPRQGLVFRAARVEPLSTSGSAGGAA
jgi:hypothetical protein